MRIIIEEFGGAIVSAIGGIAVIAVLVNVLSAQGIVL